MALPSKLTSPLSTTAVNDPEVAAQLNIDYNEQSVANGAATTLAVDPTKGSIINVTSTTASAVTLSLATSLVGTLQSGQRLTLLYSSNAATPAALAMGTGFHAASGGITLTQNKVTVAEFRYDASVPEFKLVAATTLS